MISGEVICLYKEETKNSPMISGEVICLHKEETKNSPMNSGEVNETRRDN